MMPLLAGVHDSALLLLMLNLQHDEIRVVFGYNATQGVKDTAANSMAGQQALHDTASRVAASVTYQLTRLSAARGEAAALEHFAKLEMALLQLKGDSEEVQRAQDALLLLQVCGKGLCLNVRSTPDESKRHRQGTHIRRTGDNWRQRDVFILPMQHVKPAICRARKVQPRPRCRHALWTPTTSS